MKYWIMTLQHTSPHQQRKLETVPSLRSIFVAVFWGAQGILLVDLITAGCYCGTLNKLEERCLLVETKKCAR
jgi:hypothetical protein